MPFSGPIPIFHWVYLTDREPNQRGRYGRLLWYAPLSTFYSLVAQYTSSVYRIVKLSSSRHCFSPSFQTQNQSGLAESPCELRWDLEVKEIGSNSSPLCTLFIFRQGTLSGEALMVVEARRGPCSRPLGRNVLLLFVGPASVPMATASLPCCV